MEKGIIGLIIVGVIVGIVGYFIGWYENEPDVLFKDYNVYEYTEFMTSGEAEEQGLDGGFGNYHKYSGDFEIEIDFLKLEDIVSYDISLELINPLGDNVLMYSNILNNPNSLTVISQVSQTEFYDDDFERALLIITITYINRSGDEIEYSASKEINIDEDFF